MRIAHIADVHIGKVLCDFSLLEDQEYILHQIADIIKNEQVELLLISGDIFDRAVPPAQAVELLSGFLSELIMGHGIKVFAVSGNHDSPERLGYLSGLYKSMGLHICTSGGNVLEYTDFYDSLGSIRVYALPYSAIIRARHSLELPDTTSAVRTLVSTIDYSGRNVIVAHGMFTGGEALISDSELTIGGAQTVDAAILSGFDYAALGHLHRNQTAGAPHICYSGSVLPYSISEAGGDKYINIIDIREKGNIHIESVPLSLKRRVRIVESDFEGLLSAPKSDDYVFVHLTDSYLVHDAVSRLRGVFPHVLGLRYTERERAKEGTIGLAGTMRTPLQLFCDFYKEIKGADLPPDRQEIIEDILDEVERDEA